VTTTYKFAGSRVMGSAAKTRNIELLIWLSYAGDIMRCTFCCDWQCRCIYFYL